MPINRTHCLSTRLTKDEYATLQGLAGPKRLSEWARETLLTVHTRHEESRVLLAEILAMRTIILNLHFAFGRGETVTAEAFQRLIDRADQEKVQKAMARSEARRERPDSNVARFWAAVTPPTSR